MDSALRLNTFVVHETSELGTRGSILVGSITAGTLRSGQRATVRGPGESETDLVVKSVEFLDDISTGQARIALVLSGAPSAELLRVLVPEGTVLNFH